MTKALSYWQGGTTCNMCDKPIKGDLFDARTFSGLWATMCMQCWKTYAPGALGTGHGQHYKQRVDSTWLKVGG